MLQFKPFKPPTPSPVCDTCTVHHSPVSLQCNRWWCEAAPFPSRPRYYSLLGCLPMVRVNHSCPCWCTLLFGVQTKVTNPLKSRKGHYLLLPMQRGIRLFTTTLCVLTWSMFDWAMMNCIRCRVDVLKCGKTNNTAAPGIGIINVGLCLCNDTIHHMSTGTHWLWKQDYWFRNSNVHTLH